MATEQREPRSTDDLGVAASARKRLLRPFVSEAVALPTGPELMVALLELIESGDLTARELVEVTVAWKTLIGFCTAAQLTAVGDLDRELAPETSTQQQMLSVRRTADELAPALRIAPRAASALVALVRRTENLPAAMDALADGRMDLTQLRILDGTVRGLPGGATRAVEDAAVRWAPRHTASQLRVYLVGEAMRVDPEHALRAVARGTDEREVQLQPSPLPGCRRLVADVSLVHATACWLALNGTARAPRRAGDARSLPQLRADHLIVTLTGQSTAADRSVPTAMELARHVEVQVVVAADTLSGRGQLPASVPGIGPLDPGTTRELARRSPWRRLVADSQTGSLLHADASVMPCVAPAASSDVAGCDPPGIRTAEQQQDDQDSRLRRLRADAVEVARLDHGTSRYSAPPALRLHVLTRDAGCIGPVCHHPAGAPQLDHTTNFTSPGEDGTVAGTSHHNLGSVCDRIHDAKTHGGWSLAQPTPGTFTWTSPTGRTCQRHLRPLVPGWKGAAEPPDGPDEQDRPD